MNRFLNFRNKALEEEFIKRHHLSLAKSERLGNILLISYLVTYTTKYIFDYFFRDDYTLKTMFTSMGIIYGLVLLYSIGIFLFKKFKIQAFVADLTILALGISAMVLMNNPIRTPKEDDGEGYMTFWDCYEIGTFILIMTQVMRRWHHRAFYCIFNYIYYYVWKQADVYDHLMIIKVVGFMIMTTCVFYFPEKGLRTSFLNTYHQEVSTKHILKALPEGIMILDESFDCQHFNSSLEKMFPDLRPGNKESLVELLKNILFPKSTNLFTDFKSAIFERFFSHSEKNVVAPNFNSVMSDEVFTPTNHVTDLVETARPFIRNRSQKKFTFERIKIESQEANEANTSPPTGQSPFFDSLHACLVSFFQAFQEVQTMKLNYEETLEHFYFDAKYETKTLEISISPIDHLHKRCFLLIFRDKTERELITELENSSKYKSLVLATVSHELRTPVNSTLYLLNSLIEDEDIPSSCLENYVKPAKKVLVMMLNLINDILDYSSFNQDKLKLVFQPVDIRAIITEALGLIEIQAKRKRLTLDLQLDPMIPPLFDTDPNRLTQVLLNLLSNAYKFTSKGSISVRAKMIPGDEPSSMMSLMEISVKDTGIGIKKEDVDKLFVGYEKIELGQNQKLNPNGCGLGLSIANKLAAYLSKEGFGGLQVESEVGVGSTFKFVLENKRRKTISIEQFLKRSGNGVAYRKGSGVVQSNITSKKPTYQDISLHNIIEIKDGEQPVSSKVARSSIVKKFSKDFGSPLGECSILGPTNSDPFFGEEESQFCSCPSILVVDDDAFNQLTLETLLRKLGFSIKSCFNGQEAVEEVMRRENTKECGEHCSNYMAIFMDCNMPIKDGFEATEEINKFLAKNGVAKIPIIGLSAHSITVGGPLALEAGMDYYLTKPVTVSKIREILKDIFEKT